METRRLRILAVFNIGAAVQGFNSIIFLRFLPVFPFVLITLDAAFFCDFYADTDILPPYEAM